jgi:hypothetical protein
MSATSGAGRLLDLEERRKVFDILFDGPGGRLPAATELHRMARRALAAEALISACHAYDRGRTQTEDVEAYVDFALATFPEARQLAQWRALRRRRRLGPRIAPVPPIFTATVALRRVRWEIAYRKWQKKGL